MVESKLRHFTHNLKTTTRKLGPSVLGTIATISATGFRPPLDGPPDLTPHADLVYGMYLLFFTLAALSGIAIHRRKG